MFLYFSVLGSSTIKLIIKHNSQGCGSSRFILWCFSTEPEMNVPRIRSFIIFRLKYQHCENSYSRLNLNLIKNLRKEQCMNLQYGICHNRFGNMLLVQSSAKKKMCNFFLFFLRMKLYVCIYSRNVFFCFLNLAY